MSISCIRLLGWLQSAFTFRTALPKNYKSNAEKRLDLAERTKRRFNYPHKYPIEGYMTVPLDIKSKIYDKNTPTLRLRTYRHNSRLQETKGIIFQQHGYRDYIGSFEHDSNVLAGYGYTSMGFDHRGFGQSEGKHLLIEDFESLIADSMIYYKMIKEEYPSIPIYLLGQSMGGLTCFILAHRYPQLWAGIIALSPAIAPPSVAPKWVIDFLLKFISPLICGFIRGIPLFSFSMKKISADPEIVYYLENDPLKREGIMKLGTALSIGRAISSMPGHIQGISIPVLLIQGGKDQAVNPKGVLALYNAMPTPDKQLLYMPDAWHDIMTNKDTMHIVLHTEYKWLEEHIHSAQINY